MTLLLGMFALTACVLAFWLLAGAVRGGSIQQFDERIVLSLRDPSDRSRPIGPAWGAAVGRDLTALGGVACLCLLTASVAGFLLLGRKVHALVLLLASVVGGLLLSTVLKRVMDRPRPSVVPHLSYVATTSFPSGHSMLSAVVYLTPGALLARLTGRWALEFYFLSVALLLSFLVGLSRVYLGVHYPTDVLAGWVAGLGWSVACWLLARHLQRRHAVEQPF